MKKFLLSAGMFLLFFCGIVSAEPIDITLSNGTVVTVDTDDFDSMQELIDFIMYLEQIFCSDGPLMPANP